tara:strand:- start:595 stop:966 length:372 start_codon:yes stop_codon:yes gene_type:complete
MFELRLNNKTILLNWGTLAMRLFTTKNNTDISGYFDLMAKAGNDISTLVSLVHCGYEAACIKNNQPIEYNENDVCDWIDEIGGVFKTEGQLVNFIKFIVDKTILNVSNEVKEEKKKPSKAKLG